MKHENEIKFCNEHYGQLIGYKVIAAFASLDGDEVWPTIALENDDGDRIEMVLSRDPEGNGGGFAFITKTS